MIRSAGDVADAFSSGRAHTQRFLKNAGIAGDSQWQDWSYASGQPAYDARIGNALSFTPFVASGNDAIWFPAIESDQERKLIGLRLYCTAGGAGQLSVSCDMYDLVGVYPLIDGDSTDTQSMDNTEAYPRYLSAEGVRAVLVNHVSPSVTAGCQTTIGYTDANDQDQSMSVYTATFGLGKASWSLASAGTSTGSLYLPDNGVGIKRINSVSFASAPGGLWCLYMLKPIQRIDWQAGLAAVTNTVFTEKCLCAQDSFALPTIHDGANLGFFYMPIGSSRTVSIYGSASFIWG
jgi:hypothetical protein